MKPSLYALAFVLLAATVVQAEENLSQPSQPPAAESALSQQALVLPAVLRIRFLTIEEEMLLWFEWIEQADLQPPRPNLLWYAPLRLDDVSRIV